MTYQTVLTTDGITSFAAFLYDDLTALAEIHALQGNSLLIGFDAGDEVRGTELTSILSHFEEVNIFRIDGKNFSAKDMHVAI